MAVLAVLVMLVRAVGVTMSAVSGATWRGALKHRESHQSEIRGAIHSRDSRCRRSLEQELMLAQCCPSAM